MSGSGTMDDSFYQGLRAELMGFLLRRGWPWSDAEDMAQTVVMETFARQNGVHNRRAYSYTIMKRRLGAFTKPQRHELAAGLDPQTVLSALDVHHQGVDPHQQGDVEGMVRDLLAVIWGRRRQRDVAALAMDGYPNREIAEALGMEADNVRATLRHARRTLKPLCADDDRRSRRVAHQVWEAFQRGETLPVAPRPVIRLAWRYAHALGVDPEHGASVDPLDPGELAYRRERSPLTTACSWVLTALTELAKATEQMMVVTDAHGVVLWRAGDRQVMRQADRAGFVDGACWDIAHAGANGIGLALTAGQPVTVCQAEHYVRAQHSLTCVATPVTDRTGQSVVVLNLTGAQATVHGAISRELDTIARRLKRQLSTQRGPSSGPALPGAR